MQAWRKRSHATSQKGQWGSNPVASCWEMKVLTTVPKCCPETLCRNVFRMREVFGLKFIRVQWSIPHLPWIRVGRSCSACTHSSSNTHTSDTHGLKHTHTPVRMDDAARTAIYTPLQQSANSDAKLTTTSSDISDCKPNWLAQYHPQMWAKHDLQCEITWF